jgi:hypothetical protein
MMEVMLMTKAKYGYRLVRKTNFPIKDDHVEKNLREYLRHKFTYFSEEAFSPGNYLEIYKLSYVDGFPNSIGAVDFLWELPKAYYLYDKTSTSCGYFDDLTRSEVIAEIDNALNRITRKYLGNQFYANNRDLLGSVIFTTADRDSYIKNKRLSRNTMRQIAAIKRTIRDYE